MVRYARWLFIGIIMMAMAACATGPKQAGQASSTPVESGKPSLVASTGDNYYVYKHEGRLYVIGSQEMSKQFAAHGHLPYTRTVLGAGPNGETVVYEVDTKEPAYAERLMAQYKAQQ